MRWRSSLSPCSVFHRPVVVQLGEDRTDQAHDGSNVAGDPDYVGAFSWVGAGICLLGRHVTEAKGLALWPLFKVGFGQRNLPLWGSLFGRSSGVRHIRHPWPERDLAFVASGAQCGHCFVGPPPGQREPDLGLPAAPPMPSMLFSLVFSPGSKP